MGWFSRRRHKAEAQARTSEVEAATIAHLEQFLATRRGVEAFIELPTTMARATLLLIAYDGEWTRRSVESVEWARKFATKHGLPSYDAGVVGYPQRMRDYNARQRSSRH
ncbi:MAG: hypothetical protein VB080_06550 [Propionicimonas sp.]|uniref:hypothetical protein n=1 Tax=Propionicimonas sp. TaxID=1955623 RepID=UPI002B21AFD8|nr:hypothetical protein [Propionicimonas sp.]MEA4944084.1 hypothetical protein [Propionicimonas sp.]MEA5054671.1 hypothetical protein [Propionicimonas sp.]MEA5116385.1 hypothetical protein [Propionicimonas sp.]